MDEKEEAIGGVLLAEIGKRQFGQERRRVFVCVRACEGEMGGILEPRFPSEIQPDSIVRPTAA